MRAALFFSLALAPLCAAAQKVHLAVSVGGARVGTATYSRRLLPNGGVERVVATTLRNPGGTVASMEKAVYDKNGRPVSHRTTQTLGEVTRVVTALYGARKVTLTTELNGKANSLTVNLPTRGGIANPSVLWFLKIQPKPGTRAAWADYHSGAGTWYPKYTTYLGQTSINFAGRSVSAHLVEEADTKTWYDVKGAVLKIETKSGGKTITLMRMN